MAANCAGHISFIAYYALWSLQLRSYQHCWIFALPARRAGMTFWKVVLGKVHVGPQWVWHSSICKRNAAVDGENPSGEMHLFFKLVCGWNFSINSIARQLLVVVCYFPLLFIVHHEGYDRICDSVAGGCWSLSLVMWPGDTELWRAFVTSQALFAEVLSNIFISWPLKLGR